MSASLNVQPKKYSLQIWDRVRVIAAQFGWGDVSLPVLGKLPLEHKFIFGAKYKHNSEEVVFIMSDLVCGVSQATFRDCSDELLEIPLHDCLLKDSWREPKVDMLIHITNVLTRVGGEDRKDVSYIGFVRNVETECVALPAVMLKDINTGMDVYALEPEWEEVCCRD